MRVPVSEASDLNYLLYAARCGIKAPLLWPTVIAGYCSAENNTPEITTAATIPLEFKLQTGWPERGADDINGCPLPPCSNIHRNIAAHYFCQRTPPNNLITDYIQHFSYGVRGFMRVPVSEANDLNYWLGSFPYCFY